MGEHTARPEIDHFESGNPVEFANRVKEGVKASKEIAQDIRDILHLLQ